MWKLLISNEQKASSKLVRSTHKRASSRSRSRPTACSEYGGEIYCAALAAALRQAPRLLLPSYIARRPLPLQIQQQVGLNAHAKLATRSPTFL